MTGLVIYLLRITCVFPIKWVRSYYTGIQLPWLNSCCCLVSKSWLTFCNPVDCNLPGSSIHGISQARILEWVAISFFRGSSRSRDWTHIFSWAGGFFTTGPPGKPTASLQTSNLGLKNSVLVSYKWDIIIYSMLGSIDKKIACSLNDSLCPSWRWYPICFRLLSHVAL